MKISHIICCFLLLVSCKKTEQQLTKITAKNIAIDSIIVPSTKINQLIAPYKEQLTSDMQEKLTFTPVKLTKQNISMQSTLGNLLADLSIEMANPIFKEKTKTTIDFSMFNNGGIRATIPAGNISKEHAFKLMPFDNEFVVVTLSGDKIEELVSYLIKNKAAHPLSKNIALTIKKDKTYTLKINGKNFSKDKTYTVLTTDYLQGGGDKMNFFKEPLKLTILDYKMRDAIIDYFKKVDSLQTDIDNRVTIK
ncbi:5'-nucleotidase C-terminal domain-containing protein [Polaribacter sargassicola]|uniref:5'-nucleotidase C-terminal domain-containing protein n=1 Tax=Polaribacter sargassicola TaxID=2836891 RepID=UPI001F1BC556|nr:5'-nucleotidase [Polaribacter sp. DS7-9]MCG1036810.1 5'-nucleotidase C-terminal domain-containing protein [Polaribacter sp. DS7-9]